MIRFLLCNARGLRDYQKRKKYFHYFHIKAYDVICLQETHSTVNVAKIWKTQWGGQIFYSHGINNARGVAILFKKHFNVDFITSEHDLEGRRVLVKFRYEDTPITICNVYAPNDDRPEFFEQTFETLPSETNLILGGDFNLVLDLNLDKVGGRSATHTRSQAVVKSFYG